MNPVFKKPIFVSFIGHLTLFGIFSFSFGEKIIKPEHAEISFYGSMLGKADVVPNEILPPQMRGYSIVVADQGRHSQASLAAIFGRLGFIKPRLVLSIIPQKKIFANETPVPPDLLKDKKDKSAVMFYPALPFYFNVYFTDRQTVHIEIMFKINSNLKTNAISLKRRISSGNLEVDLLVIRYLSHYLFIQQNKFTPQDWHTVQVDFSPK